MSKAILALGAGIVIGAVGMWYFGSTDTVEVDEVIESYSTPMTTDGNTSTPNHSEQGSNPEQNSATPPTSSTEGQLNLSDASNVTNNTNNTMDSTASNPANDMQNNANDTIDNAQDAANKAVNNAQDMSTTPNGQAPANQGGY